MAKKVAGFIKLQIPAGKATPAPPVGPALGQHGVNIMGFCKEFNERSRKPYYVELSVGIQTFELENYEDIQLANISADQILYEAKKNRRKSIKKKNNEL